jgi:hypothetical protein
MSWKTVLKTKDLIQANLVKNTLESNDIPAVILNKQDQAYPVIGYAEVQVHAENQDAAEVIVAELSEE